LVQQTYEAQPGLFLHELCNRVAERAHTPSATAPREKNNGRTAKQERENVKAACLSRFERQLDHDPDNLLFLDETTTITKLVLLYGQAPRGKRGRAAVLFGH
jgi:hypothetical protein